METEKNTGLPEIQTNDDEILFIKAGSIEVLDPAGSLEAQDLRLKIGKRLKEGKEELTKVCEEYHKLHKSATLHRSEKLSPYLKAIGNIDAALDVFEEEQERKRKEKEAELQKEAREQEEAAQMAEAEALEAEGHTEAAEVVISEPLYVPTVIVPTRAIKVGGIGKRKIWKFRLKDRSKINISFLVPDEKAIGALVRSQGKFAEQSIGAGSIEIYEETKRYGTGR